MRLVTLSFAGGNRYSFGFMRDLLPEQVELFPLESPGRGMRMYDALISDIHLLTNDVFNQLQQLDDDSYILLGDCVGALLAFLVTRKLAQESKSLPSKLIVSGCPAPVLFKEKKETVLKEDEMKERMISFGTDPALIAHKGFYEMLEPIMRSDFQAFNEYIYKKESLLPIPITVLAQQQLLLKEETLLWQKESSFPLVTIPIKGSLKNSAKEIASLFQEAFSNAFAH
jgi:external thioesterase TEII